MATIKHITVLLASSLLFLNACKHSTIPPYSEAGPAYLSGDYARSVDALQEPAKKGNAEAQYMLGYMYYYGLGINRDENIGRDWIRKSAQQNYAPAIQALKIITMTHEKQYIPFGK